MDWLNIANASIQNWGDYAFAATSIGLWVGSVIAMFLLIGWMRNM